MSVETKQIQKLIKKLSEVAEAKENTAYKVVVMYDSIDATEKVEIYDFNNKKIAEFKRKIEVDEDTVDAELELSDYTIEYQIVNALEEILEDAKKDKIIKDYGITFDFYEKDVANHTYTIVDIDVELFFDENEDLDAIANVINKVLDRDAAIVHHDLHSVKFTLTSIASIEKVVTYYLANDNSKHIRECAEYLVDREVASKVIDYLS